MCPFSPWPLHSHYRHEFRSGSQLLDLDTCSLDSDFVSHRTLKSSERAVTFVHYKSALNLTEFNLLKGTSHPVVSAACASQNLLPRCKKNLVSLGCSTSYTHTQDFLKKLPSPISVVSNINAQVITHVSGMVACVNRHCKH